MTERRLHRWVGSKARLAPEIAPRIAQHLDATGGRLVSLFYGSGAIEQAVGGEQIGADACPDLLACYRELQRHDVTLFRAVAGLEPARGARTEAHYRHVQAAGAGSQLATAARFLWLCTFAFNGLWRVNGKGQHNVSPDPARLARPHLLPDLPVYQTTARAVRGTTFLPDWTEALARARDGDALLVDPPYGIFDGYTAGGFGEQDHHALSIALELFLRRCPNAALIAFNAPTARGLYRFAKVEEITRSGCVSSDGDARGAVGELLITKGLQTEKRRAVGR